MSHSLVKADRGTHVRILLASMLCVTTFAALVAAQVARDSQAPQTAAIMKAAVAPTIASQDTARMVR